MVTVVVSCWCLAASGGGDTRSICTGPGPSVVIIIVVDISCLLCLSVSDWWCMGQYRQSLFMDAPARRAALGP
ncbi:hypothetical protein BJV78DRAFT_1167714 [Lactifluus subvellereus]|nr:hypothetical protein BJV78DRAFT_1167714 [Lactifluus subvellereus]